MEIQQVIAKPILDDGQTVATDSATQTAHTKQIEHADRVLYQVFSNNWRGGFFSIATQARSGRRERRSHPAFP
jgi:alkyl sulfatase BDS1-like metallo-beta-lactamase superfamily hydrolase